MDTLKDFHVPWTHIDMLKLDSFDHYLLKTISKNAAEGILMQCGGENRLEGDEAPSATQLHKGILQNSDAWHRFLLRRVICFKAKRM